MEVELTESQAELPSADLILSRFHDQWDGYLAVSPTLALDGNWPSVGVLDLLTYCLRLQPETSPELHLLAAGSAAYLAKLAARCWRPLVAELEVVNDYRHGVSLRARGGELIPGGEEIVVRVEQHLRNRLRQLPYAFPVAANFEIPINFRSNLLSKFGIGLTCGVFPGLEGPWEFQSPEDLKPLIDAAERELARQSAEHYTRCYPDEPLGQMAELYLNRMIYPPSMMDEQLPLLTTAERIAKYAEEYSLPGSALLSLARNLALSPDEQIANTGLVIYGALARNVPPPELIATANQRDPFMGFLRRAMIQMRRDLGEGGDWVETGLGSEDARRRFRVEQALGFNPCLIISEERLCADAAERALSPVIAAMCDFRIDDAIRGLDEMISLNPIDIELKAQRIKLEMVRGDIEQAFALCRQCLSEPESMECPAFLNLWGLCALRLEHLDTATRAFEAALACPSTQGNFFAEVYNNLAWAKLVQGDFAPALEAIEAALPLSACPVTLLLNKMTAHWALESYDEVHRTRRELFRIAPCDRRVFASLTLTEEVVEALLQ